MSEFLLAYFIFRLKRFKNGFSFLFERYAVILALIISGIVMTMISVIVDFQENNNDFVFIFSLIIGLMVIGTGIILWIRRGIAAHNRNKMADTGHQRYGEELADKEKEIAELKERLSRQLNQEEGLRRASHEINHRLTALERTVITLYEDMSNSADHTSTEKIKELSDIIDYIKSFSHEYQEKIMHVKIKKVLPTTQIKMIDNLFEHYLEKFTAINVEFDLKVTANILYMVDALIPQNKLETLICDHLEDALIALKASGDSLRRCCAMIGAIDNIYEFSVYDTGIPFAADTLTRLGIERVTTHAGEGGGGFGFTSTFKTMEECGASLIIRETKLSDGSFSKSITIRFDKKNQYIIKTYRPADFPESERYIIINSSSSEFCRHNNA
jgi:signal transduction histidine kinase